MHGYTWSDPDHAVNLGERMRRYSTRVIAGKQGNYEGAAKVVAASFDIPNWNWGEVVEHDIGDDDGMAAD